MTMALDQPTPRANPYRQRASQTRPFDLLDRRSRGLLRHDLEQLKKRLKALQGQGRRKGLSLLKADWRHWKRRKPRKEAHGEFESELSRLLRGSRTPSASAT